MGAGVSAATFMDFPEGVSSVPCPHLWSGTYPLHQEVKVGRAVDMSLAGSTRYAILPDWLCLVLRAWPKVDSVL